MKKIILIAALFDAMAFAQTREPLQPHLETSISQGVKDPSNGTFLPTGNWAFDLRIENPNAEPIACLDTLFKAYVDDYLDACDDGRNRVINLSVVTSGIYLELKGKQVYSQNEFGFNERVQRGGSLTKLEYCKDRDPTTLNCGFYCENGTRKFDEHWQLTINVDGWKKYRCLATGKSLETEVYCTKSHKPGDSWSEGITNGRKHMACQPSGNIETTYSCTQNPSHSLTKDNQCVPTSCGDTDHGVRGNPRVVPNGTADHLCSYGQWINEKFTCNSDAVLDNASCRLGRSCPARRLSHSETRVFPFTCGLCAQGPGGSSTIQCNDGNLVTLSKTGYCNPISHCGGSGGTEP